VLTSRAGHWYVVGHDRDRGARRSFRLSRIEGPVQRIGHGGGYDVPPDLEPGELVLPMPEPADERVAVILVRAGRAVLLRQRAVAVEAARASADTSGIADAEGQGWDAVHVVVRDVRELAQELAGYGPDVVAVEPADLREQVVRVLTRALTGAARELPAGSPV
jgi:proteasome accessory factor B